MVSRNAILVANSFVARLFERNSVQQPWVELQGWWHAEGRMHTGDLERTSHGHARAGRTGLALHTDTKHRERVEFARDVADGLKQALAAEKWHALEIFASNPFVGELRAHMNPDVQKTGHNIHPLDLTSLTAQEIETRWRQEFRV